MLKKNSDKKLFMFFFFMYAIQSKRVNSCRKNIVSMFFEHQLMSAPLEKAPLSFDQIR